MAWRTARHTATAAAIVGRTPACAVAAAGGQGELGKAVGSNGQSS
jgi:hypothetical protein